jgi:hypothetical protein
MGATEEELFADLQGNTRIMKEDTRLVTKSVNPFNRANWTLPGLHGAVERYLFEQRASVLTRRWAWPPMTLRSCASRRPANGCGAPCTTTKTSPC